jgi:hypothetical protein
MVQLSAFNTPQFDWARSRLPRRLQPVPPIFQPEIAARAILRAAHDAPRERWVGWPAVKAILFNRFAAGLGDRMAAAQAYESQETDTPADPSRPDNLFDSVDGSQGAHGRFDARAKSSSVQVWVSDHRRWIGLAVVAVLVVAAGIWLA